ncbi:MAG: hypothetical protein WC455_14235 [Dehalococcoidia bacterium]
MSELKACPFCGSPNVVVNYELGFGMDTGNWIACNQCRRSYIWSDEDGKEIWNTRPIEDAKDAEIARLREALAGCMLLADDYTENRNQRLGLISKRCRDELKGVGHE